MRRNETSSMYDKRSSFATAFRATTFPQLDEVKDLIERNYTPFTTSLSTKPGCSQERPSLRCLCWQSSSRACWRLQAITPISRISRILPTNQMKWLAMSGLSHLEAVSQANPGVHVLQEQRRMHPDICNIVSHYQYDRFLVTAPEVSFRKYSVPEMLKDQPRALWYVLDEDGDDLPSIRAERGPVIAVGFVLQPKVSWIDSLHYAGLSQCEGSIHISLQGSGETDCKVLR